MSGVRKLARLSAVLCSAAAVWLAALPALGQGQLETALAADLRRVFEKDAGKVRLVLLLSPT